MSHPSCTACERDIPGISFVIPGAAWDAICGEDHFLCPWCASERLAANGIAVKACVNISLPNFDAATTTAITAFEAIDSENSKRSNRAKLRDTLLSPAARPEPAP